MSKFTSLLVTELVREHELRQGVLPDTDLVAEITKQQRTFSQQVQQRAIALAHQHQLDKPLEHLRSLRFWLLLGLWVAAVIIGIGISRGALSGGSPLSISVVLWVLLAPTTLALMIWGVLLLVGNQGGGIGGKALSLVLLHWPNKTTAHRVRMVMELADRHGLLKPYMSLISHGFWFLIGVVSVVSLWLLLIFQQYHFYWATTLLSPEQLQQLIATLAWLPSQLGVPVPDGLLPASINAASNGMATTPIPTNAGLLGHPLAHQSVIDHSAVGRWLLALVLVYGILPRGLLLLACFGWLTMALKRADVDVYAPGIANLRARFAPQGSAGRVVDADGEVAEHRLHKGKPRHFGRGELIVSLDYEKEPDWNHTLWLNDAGVVASSEERAALLADLTSNIPARIVVRINSQLSPDRGSIRFILRLQESCGTLAAWMVGQGPYAEHWQEALAEIKVPLFSLDEEVVRWARGTQL